MSKNEIEKIEKKVDKRKFNGGKRVGSGRKPGVLSDFTIKKRELEKAIQQQIMKVAGKLINAQTSLAFGVQMLWVIKTEYDNKGNKRQLKPEVVKDHEVISDFLAGNLEGSNDFYYLATEKPDNRAADSLLDRAFGKATQRNETELHVDQSISEILDNLQ